MGVYTIKIINMILQFKHFRILEELALRLKLSMNDEVLNLYFVLINTVHASLLTQVYDV